MARKRRPKAAPDFVPPYEQNRAAFAAAQRSLEAIAKMQPRFEAFAKRLRDLHLQPAPDGVQEQIRAAVAEVQRSLEGWAKRFAPPDAAVSPSPRKTHRPIKGWHKKPARKKIKNAMEDIAKTYPEGARPSFEEEILPALRARLGPEFPRDDARAALKDYAPHLVGQRGRRSNKSRSKSRRAK